MHCWRSWFLSCLIPTATNTGIIQMTGGSLEKKKKKWARQPAVVVIALLDCNQVQNPNILRLEGRRGMEDASDILAFH